MHYYQFNIAAWALHTSHLTLEEECIYRRLLDYYYDTETPIPEETKPVIRRLRLLSHEPIVKLILQEFFHLEADGWHNSRADIEIADYKLKANKARENGKKGGRPKQNKAIETESVILANQEETTLKANYKLRTINYELETNSLVTPQAAKPSAKKQKNDLDYSVWPEQPDQQILNDWLQLRNSKKAKVSQTVLNAFGEEFRKAATFGYSVNDCLTAAISGGWQGFKFNWMQNQLTRGGSNAGYQQSNRSSGNSVGLAHDDTSWADELFGAEPQPSGGADQQSVQVIEGNFSRLGNCN